MTFVGLAILAIIVWVLNLAQHVPPPEPTPEEEAVPAESRIRGKTGPPPIWLILLMAAATAACMAVLLRYGGG